MKASRGGRFLTVVFLHRLLNGTKCPLVFPQLPPEDVKDFLEHMAVPRVNRGWEFALPSDDMFTKKHPDITLRQQMLWQGIQNK